MKSKASFKRQALGVIAAGILSTTAYAEPTRITVQIENVSPMQAIPIMAIRRPTLGQSLAQTP